MLPRPRLNRLHDFLEQENVDNLFTSVLLLVDAFLGNDLGTLSLTTCGTGQSANCSTMNHSWEVSWLASTISSMSCGSSSRPHWLWPRCTLWCYVEAKAIMTLSCLCRSPPRALAAFPLAVATECPAACNVNTSHQQRATASLEGLPHANHFRPGSTRKIIHKRPCCLFVGCCKW